MFKKILSLLLLAAGLFLIVMLVSKLGISNLLAALNKMGWNLIVLLIMPIFLYVVHAWGWSFTISADNKKKIGLLRLTLVQMIAYGIAAIQPLQGLVGESFKLAFFNKPAIDRRDLAASLLIDNTINALTIFLFSLIGLFAILFSSQLSTVVRIALISFILLISFFFILIFRIQKRGPFSSILTFLGKFWFLKIFVEKNRDRFVDIDSKLSAFYSGRRRNFYSAFLLHMLEKVHGIAEFYLIFFFLGIPVDLLTSVFIFVLVSGLDNLLFFFQIGGMELYTSAILSALSITRDSINITAGIFRRIRMLFWSVIAMLLIYPVRRFFFRRIDESTPCK